jgi:hypothetical protein
MSSHVAFISFLIRIKKYRKHITRTPEYLHSIFLHRKITPSICAVYGTIPSLGNTFFKSAFFPYTPRRSFRRGWLVRTGCKELRVLPAGQGGAKFFRAAYSGT